ncbi:Leucine Rich Repeat [Seminavis robusta]|uniref:Leucine Rich Repeat n=1 Tax=Seminavis robusta TaxID=568900 RepID=A0A9N8EAD8_9STRA|nr:Leucine Rich Repeat [Seminavis robusta]|eukprot:Sro837_g209160.1 Leucine Rich Repeat (378) ;mRNA; f:25814-26947
MPLDNLRSSELSSDGFQSALSSDTTGLAVAAPVEEHLDLQTAVPQGDTTNEQAKKNHQSKTRTLIAVGFVLVIVMVAIILAVVLSTTKREQQPVEASEMPSTGPTPAPTSFKESFLDIFPADTVQSIQQDPSSPQSQAFQWLVDYMDLLQTLPQNRIIQKFVLATIYYATNGDSWTANDNWLNHSVHECNWFTRSEFAQIPLFSSLFPGYLSEFQAPNSTCDQGGLYQHLWLDQNNLLGALPEELFLLTSLKTFSAGSNNRLGGTISTLIGKMTELEDLSLLVTQIGGSIPSEVGLLTQLSSFALRGNPEGTIPAELWTLTNLRTLGLGNNGNLRGSIPTRIGTMSLLRWISLGGNEISGMQVKFWLFLLASCSGVY